MCFNKNLYDLSLPIKHVRSQESGGGLSSADIFRTRGGLQMRTSALLGVENFGFFESYGVFARTREVEPVRTFFGQGVGQFFAILCGHFLWTVPYPDYKGYF